MIAVGDGSGAIDGVGSGVTVVDRAVDRDGGGGVALGKLGAPRRTAVARGGEGGSDGAANVAIGPLVGGAMVSSTPESRVGATPGASDPAGPDNASIRAPTA